MMGVNQGDKPMVENISCVLPHTPELGGLYLGNVYGAQDVDILKEYGISAVLNTSIQTYIAYSPTDIPFHMRIEAHDKEDYPLSEHINDCIHFIEQTRKFTNVYVHCYAGVSRSSAIISAYLMWKYKWPLSRTLKFVVAKRVVAKPNEGFMRQLQDIQTKLGIKDEAEEHIVTDRMIGPTGPVSQQVVGSQQRINHYNPRQVQQADHNPFENRAVPPPEGDVRSSRRSIAQNSSGPITYENDRLPLPRGVVGGQRQGVPWAKRGGFSDYMSPEVMPTSPRERNGTTYSAKKRLVTGPAGRGSIKGQDWQEGSGYNSNYTTNSSTYKKNSTQNKSGSRFSIRPKDLPGYKNY